MSDSVQLIPVIVHTWPVRSDVVVVSATDGIEFARFDPTDVPATPSAAHRVQAPSDERIAAALAACEIDQDMLQTMAGTDGWVGLQMDPAPAAALAAILAEHGLDCDAVEYHRLNDLIAEIDTWPLHRLWPLVADWWDRAVLRYPAGYTRTYTTSPLAQATPEVAALCGPSRGGHAYLRELIDAPLGPFGLHNVLLWRYLSRSEFPEEEIAPPAALLDAPPTT